MKKKTQVVMLPTNEKANKGDIILSDNSHLNKPSLLGISVINNNYNKALNLYILSDEEVREGDWYIHKQIDKYVVKQCISNVLPMDAKKTIATTDISLKLPQPSPEFIEVFIREYNKGNMIERVMVEYEVNEDSYLDLEIGYINYNSNNLKVDKNNYITITRVKDSWNKEEMYSIMQQYLDYCHFNDYITPMKWIEENL